MFYTVNPPLSIIENIPYSDTTDRTKQYISFRTDVTPDTGDFKFLGTEIYYKIYSDEATLKSHISSIEAVNTSSNYGGATARLLGLDYRPLECSPDISTPLIKASVYPAAADIKIRLTSYMKDNPEFMPYIMVNNVKIGEPRREGNKNAFDFGREPEKRNELFAIPGTVGSEKDFTGSSTSRMYYINLYAFCVGRDATYTNYYSQVLHLGTIPVDMDQVWPASD
ncbi:MAG: hypothetical protein MJ169_06735 [Treponema sp.]|nr:hypothetical protein [Treponema sp.]